MLWPRRQQGRGGGGEEKRVEQREVGFPTPPTPILSLGQGSHGLVV